MDFDKEKLSEKAKEKISKKFDDLKGKVNREDVENLVKNFEGKFGKIRDKLKSIPAFTMFIKQCELLYQVIKEWLAGNYPLPWKIVGAIAAALLYVINPIDIIPDFIPIIGFIDDFFVVLLCLKMVKSELRKYCDTKGLDKTEYGL